MKLPAFYLLDAISKNVFDPYARHFAPFVIPLFLDTYHQVDQATRSKMEEMLLTWRTGAPSGKEVFGVISQLAIERGVWGGDSTSSMDVSDFMSRFATAELSCIGTNIGPCLQSSSPQRTRIHIGSEGENSPDQSLGRYGTKTR